MTAPVYLLAGEEFLADEALDRVRAESGADPLSEAAFTPADDVAAILGALTTSSLLGGRRLVIVREAQDLRKEQADALARYLEAPSPESVLALVATSRTKLDAVVKKVGAVVALEAPRGRALAGWVRARASEAGFKLDDRGAWALLDSVGTELRDLDAAVAQLATALGAGARVGPREVRQAFPRLADERIYVLTDAVGERRLAPAMAALRRLLLQGEPPLMLFGALTAHIRRMLRVRRAAERGTRAVADLVGLPEWRAERLRRQALAYREEELVDAMALLAEVDVEMKGGDWGDQPEIPLEKALLAIVTGTTARSSVT